MDVLGDEICFDVVKWIKEINDMSCDFKGECIDSVSW